MADIVSLEGNTEEGDFVLLCDHASNRVPPGFGRPGVSPHEMERHIAWDIGALGVARGIARRLGSPLIFPNASRLLIDCNRPISAPDSIAEISEDTIIPGNRDLPQTIRSRRISRIYETYHDAIAETLLARAERPTSVLAIHSFTPVFRGAQRPWHIGIVANEDRRLADPLSALLRQDPDLVVGDNEPYSPADGVYHTLERHAAARGLPAVMIEIRNDLISTPEDQDRWALRLAGALGRISAVSRSAA